jgi:hypothetical protein
MMFELIIFCVIFIAVAYSATLWFMGRREDVLHGEFVHVEQPSPEPLPQPALTPAPQPPLPPVQPKANPENLRALLEVIKRDLNDAASA